MDSNPKERTRIMLERARRKLTEHEKASRVNQGNSDIPLGYKLRVALPLAAIAIGLFGFSFYYRDITGRQIKEALSFEDDKVVTENPEEQETVVDYESMSDNKSW